MPRRGEGGGKPPQARRVRRIRGSERMKVLRIRKKRIGKTKSSEDQRNSGRCTRRPGGSADFIHIYIISLKTDKR